MTFEEALALKNSFKSPWQIHDKIPRCIYVVPADSMERGMYEYRVAKLKKVTDETAKTHCLKGEYTLGLIGAFNAPFRFKAFDFTQTSEDD